MFTPDNAAIRSYLSSFAKKNAERTKETPFTFAPSIDDYNLSPSSNLGMVPVIDDDFIYQYSLRNKNVTAWGMAFL